MSWQGYVDNLLKDGKFDQAAIFSAAGDSVWAASTGFTVKPEEIKTIIEGYSNTSKLYSEGVFIGGVKNVCVRADDRSIYAKKDKHGYCIVKTKQAIIVGHWPEDVQPGAAAVVIEKLADYLLGVGY